MASPPLNPVEAALRATVETLSGLGYRFALVGGLAVSAHAEPRTTRDVDIAVLVRDDASAEALVHSLGRAGFRVLATVDQDAAGRLATVRLGPPTDRRERGVVVDLLFASSGIEEEVVSAAEAIELVPGLTLPIASRGHLIALKVLSRGRTRPQDDADLLALLGVAAEEDIREARVALGLIGARGYGRGKDLGWELEEALQKRP